MSDSGSDSGSRSGMSDSGSDSGSRSGMSDSGSDSGPVVVTIDGPAGSGKSTVAAALAVRLDLPHVDTGAYYRAATLAVLRAGVDPADGAACATVAADIDVRRRDGRTFLGGVDVETEIRGPQVTALVSQVSGHPPVRAALLAAQRRGIAQMGAVVEGRDAGTVVVPTARFKVWLTAAPEERAARRAAQLGETDPAAVAAHAAAIAARDRADADRTVRPPDAVEIDTSGRSVTSIVDELQSLITG
jgi:cytidylate kinase